MKEKGRILIVDDDEGACRSLSLIFGKKGYKIETARTGKEAIQKAQGRLFHAALLDIKLPDIGGVELLRPLRKMLPDIVLVMITAYASQETAVQALNDGVSANITKPFNMDEVLVTVRQALEKQRLVMENRRLYQEAQRELAQRKKAEEEIKALSLFPSENPNPVLRVATDGTVIYANDPGKKILKAEVGKKIPEDYLSVLKKAAASDQVIEFEQKVENRYFSSVFRYVPQGSYANIYSTEITKQKWTEEALRRSFEKLQRTMERTIQCMVRIVELRDPYTAGHQRRVMQLACAIAKEMGLSKKQVGGIHLAGLIHDIGKINIPAEILTKPGQLAQIEFDIIRTHPKTGHEIAGGVEFPLVIANIILQHHERMNGSGYPQGLSGKDIMLEARILAVADVVEAMCSHRPYRATLGPDKALEEISKNKSILYDPEAVEACLRVFTEKGFRFQQEKAATSPNWNLQFRTSGKTTGNSRGEGKRMW